MITQKSNLDTEVQALSRIAGKPSLTALSYALRHPETWPEGFEWNYNYCNMCAMGLAAKIWQPDLKENVGLNVGLQWTIRNMAIPYREAYNIFKNLGMVTTTTKKFLRKPVTVTQWAPERIGPDDVADAIDRYLTAA